MTQDPLPQPAKFDFGTVFDSLVDDAFDTEREKEPTWNAAELEQEKAASFAEGLQAGQTQALEGIEQRIALALEDLMRQAGVALGRLTSIETQLSAEAKELSVTVGRALASELLTQAHRQEIESIVSEALGFLTQQPHVVVRVNEDLLDGFKSRFDRIAEAQGFQGKLIILGEPDLDQADCRIEWAEGGIARDGKALNAKMDEIVQRHLAPDLAPDGQSDLFTYADEASVQPQDPVEGSTE